MRRRKEMERQMRKRQEEKRKESPGSVEKNIKSPDKITRSVRYFNLAPTMCRTLKLYAEDTTE